MIKITDKYFVEARDDQYTVLKVTKRDDREDCKIYLTYHRDLESAIESIMRKVQRDRLSNNDMTLSEAIRELKLINQEFSDKLTAALNGAENLYHEKG